MTKKTSNAGQCFAIASAIAILFFVSLTGCENSTSVTSREVPSDLRDSTITGLHGLSWMGGKSHPLTQSFQIPDPENADIDVSPGGIVLVEVADGSPLHAAELKAGDAAVSYTHLTLPTICSV